MAPQTQRLLDEALLLPENDRLKVAAELLGSVSGPPSLDRPDWEAEILRRAEAAVAGQAGVPWDEVRHRAEQRLRRPGYWLDRLL